MEQFILEASDWVPNNPRFPVLSWHGVAVDGDTACAMEDLFRKNGWEPQWRDGVYDYHHYHSTAHEVLGFAAGHATLMLGGPGGRTMKVTRGDVLLLPTGTGHCRIEASSDFLVTGGYPPGQDWDICRKAATPDMLKRMLTVPFPDTDPVEGKPMAAWWKPE